MGSFEDSIKDTFEGKSVKAPTSAWSQVESGLNADFVQSYQSKQSKYKWVAAAAMLVAFLSLAVHYEAIRTSSAPSVAVESSGYYNALLTERVSDAPQSQYYNSIRNGFLPVIVSVDRSKRNAIVDYDKYKATPFTQESKFLQAKRPGLASLELEETIYPYHQGGSYSNLSSSRKLQSISEKIWAGVEAGAGNFEGTPAGSNTFTGSVNQSNLATALGSDGFVNPSTNVNPELNDGIATSLGLDVGFRIGEKWTVETGLAYTSVDTRGDASINVLDIYTIENNEFFGVQEGDIPVPSSSRETALEVQDSYDYDVALKSNMRFTSIPLKAGYFVVDRKMSLRLNVGLAANYFMGSQINAENNLIEGTVNDSFNEWSFDGLGGVELGYSIFDKLDLTLEPNYRQSITPLTNDNSATSRFLIQTGLRYNIQ